MTNSFCLSVAGICLSFICYGLYYLSVIDVVNIAAELSELYPPTHLPGLYHDPSLMYPDWVPYLRSKWKIIQQEIYEFEKYSNQRKGEEFSQCHQIGDGLLNHDDKWITITFLHWNMPKYPYPNHLFQTVSILNEIIEKYNMWFRAAQISILHPKKFIPRHRGTYAGMMSYHLTIDVNKDDVELFGANITKNLYLAVWTNTSVPLRDWPAQYVPIANTFANKVDDDIGEMFMPIVGTWSHNGSDLLFDDSCVHEAFNNGNHQRIVLILDPERRDEQFKNSIIAQFIHNYIVKGFLTYVDKYQQFVDSFLEPKEKDNLSFCSSKDDEKYDQYRNFSNVSSYFTDIMTPWYNVNDTFVKNVKTVDKAHDMSIFLASNLDHFAICLVLGSTVATFLICNTHY